MSITWTYDAPSGVYKSHALSRAIFEAAIEEVQFASYAEPVRGFGRKRGESITLPRVGRLAEPANAKLQEGTRIPEDALALSTVTITVNEYGRAVPFTSLLEDLSEINIENQVQRLLKEQQRLVMDTAAAAAFKTAKVCYIPTSVSAGTFDTDGTPSTTATANWNVFHVEEIADYLYDTLLAPPYEGDDYIAIVRTLGLRGIKRDPAWEQWHLYTNPEAKAAGEVGRIERMRFIQTNHNNALGKVGTGSVLGEGVVFGRDAVAFAEAVTPELRMQLNANNDFGRSRAIAWYGVMEWGLIFDTSNAGEARVVRVTSA
ncbi:MAG TPA: N4-gp56 family major capsid protein [Thermodesulfobacteriota bacterium]